MLFSGVFLHEGKNPQDAEDHIVAEIDKECLEKRYIDENIGWLSQNIRLVFLSLFCVVKFLLVYICHC